MIFSYYCEGKLNLEKMDKPAGKNVLNEYYINAEDPNESEE